MAQNDTNTMAMDMSEAVMQTALERNSALNAMLCPMRRAAAQGLSNEVSTSLDAQAESTAVTAQERAAFHQVIKPCNRCVRHRRTIT